MTKPVFRPFPYLYRCQKHHSIDVFHDAKIRTKFDVVNLLLEFSETAINERTNERQQQGVFVFMCTILQWVGFCTRVLVCL